MSKRLSLTWLPPALERLRYRGVGRRFLKQRNELHLERSGEALKHFDSGVLFTALQPAKVRAVNTRIVGQPLLRDVLPDPQAP